MGFIDFFKNFFNRGKKPVSKQPNVSDKQLVDKNKLVVEKLAGEGGNKKYSKKDWYDFSLPEFDLDVQMSPEKRSILNEFIKTPEKYGLKKNEANVFIMHNFFEMSLDEIAKKTNASKTYVNELLNSAKHTIKIKNKVANNVFIGKMKEDIGKLRRFRK